MIAGILKSEKAIKMNIAIIEAFIALKEYAFDFKEISSKLANLQTNTTNSLKIFLKPLTIFYNLIKRKSIKKIETQ